MEEVIDFDTWIKNYIPQEIEFYAIYDPESYQVIGIYPEVAAAEKTYKIKIDKDLAEDIQNGIVKMNSCFVDVEAQELQIIEQTGIRKIDDIIHRIIENKFSNISKPDIIVTYNQSMQNITFAMSKTLRSRKIKWPAGTVMQFLVTSYNDPHIVFQTLTINLEELHQQDQIISYTGTDNRFSVYTRRLFKNYIFEIK
jgi:hypothetical protein